MITLVEALNFRCLRYIRQPLGTFHVLVGPNASGKTTFLDVISFLGCLVSEGLEVAVDLRSADFRDLVWRRQEGSFSLAVEAQIPESLRQSLPDPKFRAIRYEITAGQHSKEEEVSILAERVLFTKACSGNSKSQSRLEFPAPHPPPSTIVTTRASKGTKTVVNKVRDGNDNFYDETGKGWDHAFKLGPRKSALSNLPEDESRFPVATWLKRLLAEGVQELMLDSLEIRRPSPPGLGRLFRPDGSNLPWVIDRLQRDSPERFRMWIEHVKTALPDLEAVRTVEREDDRHRYLVLSYRGGVEVPSFVASDGTLRLLALTLLAYLPDFRGVYLIEEPENGIHPRAVETVFQSLSSVYEAQILLATHSPIILSLAESETVLCFGKSADGATDIVLGSDHPALRDWKRDTNLGDLFAAGVLGQ